MFRGGITADTALRLGRWFGARAGFWLDLQKLHELRQARSEIGGEVEKLPRFAGRKPKSDHTLPAA
jgi:plasmid maintenance system antidote protein VapI